MSRIDSNFTGNFLTPDGGQIGYGNLNFTDTDATITFHPPAAVFIPGDHSTWQLSAFPSVLHLVDSHGRVLIVLQGCFVRQLNTTGQVSVASANSALVFNHSVKQPPATFTEMTLLLHGLREWTAYGLHDLAGSGGSLTMRAELPENLSCKLFLGIGVSESWTKRTEELTATLTFTSPIAQTFEYWLEHAAWTSAMISLCAGHACIFSELHLDTDQETAILWVPKINMDPENVDRDHRLWPFSLERDINRGSELIVRWYGAISTCRTLANLFIEDWLRPVAASESKFTSLMQGLESYHRRAFVTDDKYMDVEFYDILRKILTRNIPKEFPVPVTLYRKLGFFGPAQEDGSVLVRISEAHRDSLGARIKFGNELSLRNRLKLLLASHPDAAYLFMSAFRRSSASWIELIINLRNEITHYSGNWPDFERERAKLFDRVYELRILCWYLLLFELLGSKKFALQTIRRTNDFRMLLSRRPYDIALRTTWLYSAENHVDLMWAASTDLEAWTHYCPRCGYTSIDSESMPGEDVCRSCGSNTTHEDRYEVEEVADLGHEGKPDTAWVWDPKTDGKADPGGSDSKSS